MSKSFGIIAKQKNKKNGWQIVYMFIGNYFHRNGFELDKYEVEDAWFENREDAEYEAMNLQYVSEN